MGAGRRRSAASEIQHEGDEGSQAVNPSSNNTVSQEDSIGKTYRSGVQTLPPRGNEAFSEGRALLFAEVLI
jgi:hypothetical protein